MKGKLKKNILIFFIAIFFIAIVTGYLMWNKPHRNVKDAEAVKITAIDLYKIFTQRTISGRRDRKVEMSKAIHTESLILAQDERWRRA